MFFVRTASDRDLAQIREVLVETWHATYDQELGAERVTKITDDWHAPEKLAERLKQPHSEFLVADDGTCIGGMAFASANEKMVTLHQLYILPQFHGQKLGLELLIEIENSFPECERIRLEVGQSNDRAIEFYKNYGFAIVGETGHCMQDGSDIPAFLMEKPIIYDI